MNDSYDMVAQVPTTIREFVLEAYSTTPGHHRKAPRSNTVAYGKTRAHALAVAARELVREGESVWVNERAGTIETRETSTNTHAGMLWVARV